MWIARDKNGDLALFNHKPIWNRTEAWIPNLEDSEWTGSWVALDDKLFPEISWENEPVKVNLVVQL